MPRLYGAGHFTEDPYSQVVSPHGIPVDDLVAVLQEEIRRSRIDNAVLAAYEMSQLRRMSLSTCGGVCGSSRLKTWGWVCPRACADRRAAP
jgi:hypothetical protein